MKEKILQLIKDFEQRKATVSTKEEVEALRLDFIGKKGLITLLMQDFRNVPAEEKREIGMLINEAKQNVESSVAELKEKIEEEELNKKLESEPRIDCTLPVKTGTGALSPRTILQKQIVDMFVSMGFTIEDGNEIETEYNNFDAVNVPASHPARDMQDTFWLDNGEVLKTQTSAAQNRILRTHGPKCRVLFPGRCFRNESLDATHENTFFQIEGVVVDENVSVANLIYFMKEMLKGVFKKDVNVRLRPGFFPFTEPSFELDATCPLCAGKGCGACSHTGWMELCPCGMIHPNVLREAGIDPDKYNGFAFGLGFDRLVMIKTGLDDIRHLNGGNVKLLKQYGTKI
ncbi:MAG: phenylalanine--tRNA ligase subunit alpha [Clostridia bacterium]|nr:phenylalanine--tRNA ligase subunit alpha [Clostridia bacterium]